MMVFSDGPAGINSPSMRGIHADAESLSSPRACLSTRYLSIGRTRCIGTNYSTSTDNTLESPILIPSIFILETVPIHFRNLSVETERT